MKTTYHSSRALLAGAALLLTATIADARSYGVSSSSAGRGTKYTTERGGTAYVGPRGVAGETAGGSKYAAGQRGAAYSGPNSAGAVSRYGGAAVTTGGAVYTRPATTTVVATTLPAGYIRVVPTGYTTVVYRGYSCRYVGGIYYRAVMYQGATVYVVVR